MACPKVRLNGLFASDYLTKALDSQKALTALYVPMSLVLIGTAFTTGAVVTAGATVGVTTSGPLAKELVAITPRPRTDASSIDPTIFFFIQALHLRTLFLKCFGQIYDLPWAFWY